MKTSLLTFLLIGVVLTGLTACGESKTKLPTVSANVPATIDERSLAVFSVTTSAVSQIQKYHWVQDSGPMVSFTDNASRIEFTVPEVSKDTEISFTITVTDSDGDTASTQARSLIKDINRAPIVDDMHIDVELDSAVEFTLIAVDPDGNTLTTFIPDQTLIGDLELLDASQRHFKYTSAKDNIKPESIKVEVSDGIDTVVAHLNITIVDNNVPKVIAVSPTTNSKRVELNTLLVLEFDDIMADITDATGNVCQGAIQISSDDFKTCNAYSIATSDHKVFTLTPSSLASNHVYQVKVSAKATNFYGIAAIEKVVSKFETEHSDLQLSEVSLSLFIDDNRWVELYNGTNKEIDLGSYALQSESGDLLSNAILGNQFFELPSVIIKPGEYIVAQSALVKGSGNEGAQESSQLVLLGVQSDSVRPYWDSSGFVELVNQDTNTTVDFLSFGNNNQQPMTLKHWNTISAGVPVSPRLGMSFIRTDVGRDTNASDDWQVAAFMTPGGPNDVLCANDADEDGIPDCAEQKGSTFAGLPLYEWGARAGVKDIFVEVDYMKSTDAGIKPQRAALKKVVDVFAARGYVVHFDVGKLFHPEAGNSAKDFDLGGGNEVNFYLQTTFDYTANSPSIFDFKIKNFDLKRRPIFHYMLMANSQNADGSASASGVGEVLGNDLIISLGSWGLNLATQEARNVTINVQSSTIFHEIGHNLGLAHGGNDNINHKPNHVSSMNYLYQNFGLPAIGQHDGDRYFATFFVDDPKCGIIGGNLTNGPKGSPADFVVDYSSGGGQEIRETLVDERLGLGFQASHGVDYNCNGILNEKLAHFDLNHDLTPNQVFRDVDEWSLLSLQFTRHWAGASSGQTISGKSDAKPRQNVMHNDRQRVSIEYAPSAAFFNMINTK